ncbi:MAG TPA: signal peptide peptidase SppA [Armatimonadota bacterium]|nr:signal peptide peptidase SppA [Armatimonadota bacterium]
MNRRTTVIVILVVALVVLFIIVAAISVAVVVARVRPITGGDVALIRVEGVITSGRGSVGVLGDGTAGAERIVKLLERFRKDRSVKSLVLRINSRGGSAAGSQEIYREVMRVRRDGKKVTVSMGDVAASGGYYIASAADRIYADPATLTGSIGVIMETADIHELLGRFGIGMNTIKSGKLKDIGSMSRAMTPEERKILQTLIDDVFDQFVSDVSIGRKLPRQYVVKLADGRVYTGKQAVRLRLVDRTGGLEDALRHAAREAGIRGEFSVVEYERYPGLLDLLFGGPESKLAEWPKRSGALGDLAERLLYVDAGRWE